jgi:hypothetical protein
VEVGLHHEILKWIEESDLVPQDIGATGSRAGMRRHAPRLLFGQNEEVLVHPRGKKKRKVTSSDSESSDDDIPISRTIGLYEPLSLNLTLTHTFTLTYTLTLTLNNLTLRC